MNNVFTNGRKAFEVGVAPTDVPTMPIEFSVAAFRLGHSMIRRAYNWNRIFDDGFGSLDLLFVFSATAATSGADPRLPSTWIADFRRLYDFKEAGRADLAVPESKFNRAMRIDTRLVNPLKNLPTGSFGGPAVPFNDPRANLAFRNLTRAKMVRLATGQQMATFLQGKGVTLTKLTSAQIRDGNNGADLDALTQPQRAALLKDTPLWFYILREAELNGGKLKGVGARIVAETFHRAMEGSQASIVRDPTWRPTLGPEQHDVPDGRPAALRLPGKEGFARSTRVASRVAPAREVARCSSRTSGREVCVQPGPAGRRVSRPDLGPDLARFLR